jgi:hypothetical protein
MEHDLRILRESLDRCDIRHDTTSAPAKAHTSSDDDVHEDLVVL